MMRVGSKFDANMLPRPARRCVLALDEARAIDDGH
jgi:hypothetical protein